MTEELDSKQRLALRVGHCRAVVCSQECEVFVSAGYLDGFTICTCGHTQWAHATERTRT